MAMKIFKKIEDVALNAVAEENGSDTQVVGKDNTDTQPIDDGAVADTQLDEKNANVKLAENDEEQPTEDPITEDPKEDEGDEMAKLIERVEALENKFKKLEEMADIQLKKHDGEKVKLQSQIDKLNGEPIVDQKPVIPTDTKLSNNKETETQRIRRIMNS